MIQSAKVYWIKWLTFTKAFNGSVFKSHLGQKVFTFSIQFYVQKIDSSDPSINFLCSQLAVIDNWLSTQKITRRVR